MPKQERAAAHAGGKRVAPKKTAANPRKTAAKKKSGGGAGLVVFGVFLAAVVTGYLVLCAKAGSDTLWPGTSMMGIDLGGLTYQECADKLEQELPAILAERNVELYEPSSGARVRLEAEGLLETDTLVDDLWASRDLGDFFTRGARYVNSLVSQSGGIDLPAVLEITEEGEQRLDAALKEVAQQAGVTGNEASWIATDTELVLTKGITSRTIDAEKARNDVKKALTEGNGGTVEVSTTLAPPADVDLEAIRAEIHTDPVDASLNVKTMDINSEARGVDLDVEAARAAFDAIGEGEQCRVPLTINQPKVTASQLKALLFRDTLGSAVTKFTGTADRLKSIKNAAGFINGRILLPGEEFSYNGACEPYTEANGYGKAGAYINGHTVDTVAGGICQLSSTLYWATLKANLKITERHNHAYYPSYISGGLDATVYGGGANYRFVNNTDYPVKLEAYVDSSRYVHTILYGTNLTGIHGEPYATNKVITRKATTVYEADSSIPRGTTKKDSTRTAYDGATIEAYQKLVDADGNTVSVTLLHKDTYRHRDAVILYNPADAGNIPGNSSSQSTPSDKPSATPTPEATPTPSPTPEPTETLPIPIENIPGMIPTTDPNFQPPMQLTQPTEQPYSIQDPSIPITAPSTEAPLQLTQPTEEPIYTNPEPVYTPEPAYIPEQVYTPEPIYTPDPVYTPEPVYTPDPIIPTIPPAIPPMDVPVEPAENYPVENEPVIQT